MIKKNLYFLNYHYENITQSATGDSYQPSMFLT